VDSKSCRTGTVDLGLVYRIVCLFTSQPLGQCQIMLLVACMVNNLPKVTMHRYPAKTQTHDLLVTYPMLYQVSPLQLVIGT